MDFIRWMVLDKYRDFTDSGLFIGVWFVNFLLTFLIAILALVAIGGFLGITIFTVYILVSGIFWSLFIFVHFEQWYLRVREEFRKKTGKE